MVSTAWHGLGLDLAALEVPLEAPVRVRQREQLEDALQPPATSRDCQSTLSMQGLAA